MDDGNRGYVLAPGNGIGGEGSLKATAATTGGSLTVIESTADGGAPLHVHAHDDEAFYVLDGAITVRIGDETFDAPRGAFVWLPRGIPHAWDVPAGTATVLILTAPAGLDTFLHRFHTSATKEERDAAARDHGITFLPEG